MAAMLDPAYCKPMKFSKKIDVKKTLITSYVACPFFVNSSKANKPTQFLFHGQCAVQQSAGRAQVTRLLHRPSKRPCSEAK